MKLNIWTNRQECLTSIIDEYKAEKQKHYDINTEMFTEFEKADITLLRLH